MLTANAPPEYVAAAQAAGPDLHLAKPFTELVKSLNSLIRQSASETGQAGEAFAVFAKRWKRETAMLSSVARKIGHPAYKRIVELGAPAVPHILCELRGRPSFWSMRWKRSPA